MSNQARSATVSTVQSVDRAMAVMEILGREGWAGVTEIAGELGTHKSTVFRLLATLERRGMVEQHPSTQKYRLGFTVVRLAAAVRSSLDLTGAARPVCEQLSRDTAETVHLAVLEANEVVHIYEVNLSSQMVSVNWLGRHTSLHATSSGKVFLAHLPPRVREEILEGPLERLTPATITDPDLLRAQFETIRSQGYGHTVEELEEGLNAVAAPIRGADGSVIACVSVSGPSYRLEPDGIGSAGALTVQAAAEISRRLGYLGEPWAAQSSDAEDVAS